MFIQAEIVRFDAGSSFDNFCCYNNGVLDLRKRTGEQ